MVRAPAGGAVARGQGRAGVFFAFDLVRLDGWNLADVPLVKRKGLLQELLAGATGRSAIQFSDHVEGAERGSTSRCRGMGLEGVVSKRASAVYHPGRSNTWVKCKAKLYGDFVIAGYTASPAAGGLGVLALGEWVDGDLVYRGKVGTGFDSATLADLLVAGCGRWRTGSWRSRVPRRHPLGAAGPVGQG